MNKGMWLKTLKIRKRLVVVAYPVAALLGFLLLWEVVVRVLQLPAYLVPAPVDIVRQIYLEADYLLEHTWVTTLEAFLGLVAGTVGGFLLAIIITWSKPLERTVLPLTVFVKAMPKVAIAPLLVIWFGFGMLPKVIVTFLMCFFPIVINTIAGLAFVEPAMLDLINSMKPTKWQVFTKVRIPNSLPYFFAGFKLAAVLALIGAVVGEFVGADAGLGRLILIAQSRMNTSLVFAIIIVLTFIGVAFFYIALWLESIALPWKPPEEEAKTLTTGA